MRESTALTLSLHFPRAQFFSPATPTSRGYTKLPICPRGFCKKKKKSQILHPKCKILQAEKATFAKILQCFYTA